MQKQYEKSPNENNKLLYKDRVTFMKIPKNQGKHSVILCLGNSLRSIVAVS